MSEPKTIRDAYHQFIDADSTTESTVYEFLTCYGGHRFIPGADAVVTPQGREAAGRRYWERTRQLRVDELNAVEWEDLSPVRRIELTEEADYILEAAGIEVVKEVVTAEGRYIPSMRLVGRTPLLIKRKEKDGQKEHEDDVWPDTEEGDR